MNRSIFLIALALSVVFTVNASAGVPMDVVQGHVGKVLDVLRAPDLQGEAAENEKKEKIRAIVDEMFDFSALSRSTLSRNWKKLSSEQQKEFVSLYRDILEKTYIDRLLAYKDEDVVFVKERMLSEKKAEIQTHVVTKTGEIPIDYRVLLRSGQWRVYDVVIEGVSLVKNYRSQFKGILKEKPPEGLLEILREKASKT